MIPLLHEIHAAVTRLAAEEIYIRGEGYWAFRRGGDCGTCTTAANLLAQELRGKVVGFHKAENPSAIITQRFADGHDFAWIAERYIVDYWAWRVARCVPKSVFDSCNLRDLETIKLFYGRQSSWSTVADYTGINFSGEKPPDESRQAQPDPVGFTYRVVQKRESGHRHDQKLSLNQDAANLFMQPIMTIFKP
jgi:hypothetical protein